MLLTVEISGWELEDAGCVLSVGDTVQFWLTFEQAEGRAHAGGRVSVIRGVAVPLPTWHGAGFERHPLRIDVDGGALYWDAPERITGPIEVAGTIRTNNVDAPEGFPQTSGVVRRVRMVWDDVVVSSEGGWQSDPEGTRYEEVTSTYFPPHEPMAFDSTDEAELLRLARVAYEREAAAGRLRPGESFGVGLRVPASDQKTPPGTRRTRWTGALLDLDTGGGSESDARAVTSA
jgi:hypothetical protein